MQSCATDLACARFCGAHDEDLITSATKTCNNALFAVGEMPFFDRRKDFGFQQHIVRQQKIIELVFFWPFARAQLRCTEVFLIFFLPVIAFYSINKRCGALHCTCFCRDLSKQLSSSNDYIRMMERNAGAPRPEAPPNEMRGRNVPWSAIPSPLVVL